MAMASGAPYELESLVQDDFLRDLRASDIDVVPLDTTDLILDAYENDEFWLSADSSATPKQIHANNLQLGHPGSSRAVFARSRDASPQVEILYKLQHIPAELMVERKPQSPIATANRAVKQGQLYKKVRASRIKKSMQTKGKRQRGTTDSAPVLPLSAYNFFFRVERIRLLDAVTANENSPLLQSSDAICLYAHILSGSRREFEDMVLRDQWERDPNEKRKHCKSHGRISFRSLAKLISQSWGNLPEEIKQVFYSISAQDFERFELEKRKTVSVVDLRGAA